MSFHQVAPSCYDHWRGVLAKFFAEKIYTGIMGDTVGGFNIDINLT